MANIEEILDQLMNQRNRLNEAIEALSSAPKRVGRPHKPKSGRRFSAAARKRLSEAAKARWAKAKKAGNNSL
jgi:hypothetical protein